MYCCLFLQIYPCCYDCVCAPGTHIKQLITQFTGILDFDIQRCIILHAHKIIMQITASALTLKIRWISHQKSSGSTSHWEQAIRGGYWPVFLSYNQSQPPQLHAYKPKPETGTDRVWIMNGKWSKKRLLHKLEEELQRRETHELVFTQD